MIWFYIAGIGIGVWLLLTPPFTPLGIALLVPTLFLYFCGCGS